MRVYYLIEQRDRRNGAWFVYGSTFERHLSDARAYKAQILREELAKQARIVRVVTTGNGASAKVVR